MKTIGVILILATLAGLLCAPLGAQVPNDCNMGWAIRPRVDPRNTSVICLPEFGRMSGVGSHYGERIWPLPDLDRDGLRDWAIHHSVDTLFDHPDGRREGPYEILIYRGRRGGLPDPFDYERVGPTELGSVSWLVAHGDWDNSGSTDLAVAIRIIGDTSAGNTLGYDTNILVVFWGDSLGRYSITDTTRLANGYELWFGPGGTVGPLDVNSDGVPDLITLRQAGFSSGGVRSMPGMLIWYGHDGGKWGRDGMGRKYDWSWWSAPAFDKIIDHDSDGLLDLAGQTKSPPTSPEAVAYVLYGDDKPFLDTTALQVIRLYDTAQCETSLFTDVTGDGIPELVALSGGAEQNTIKIYIGLRGQRLGEQFGSGADPARPGQDQWWGRPWAEVWQPFRINDYWTRNDRLYDFGDADLDGIDDIWSYSYPFLLEYNSATRLDSLIDAMVLEHDFGAHAKLGDIDGSGVPTIALYAGPGITFYKMAPELRFSPFVYRLLPPGTGRAAAPDDAAVPAVDIGLRALPGSSPGEIELHWDGELVSGPAVVTLISTDGRELASANISGPPGRCVLPVGELPGAAYLITLRFRAGVATTKFARP